MKESRIPSVTHIVASLDDEAAGPSYSVAALSKALRARRTESTIMSVGCRSPASGLEVFPRDWHHMPLASRLLFSRPLARSINQAASLGSVLHAHGLWRMPNIYPARAALRHSTPLVVSPRGMLGDAALAFSAKRKKVFWRLTQRRALQAASCFHATSEAEREDLRRAGLTAPVAVIPNGIDIPDRRPEPAARTLLHLGRLHPKKGIDRLIAAWARVAGAHPDWRLRIVGPSELGCREALEAQVFQQRVPRVVIESPLYGEEKWDAYYQAGLFVLPTLNENFGMVVAEALAAGVPAISTKGAPWQGLETERCGWWVDHGPDAMATALDSALALPDIERAAMGTRGRDWMARDFSWDEIAARMGEVYAWCLGNRERPSCVVME